MNGENFVEMGLKLGADDVVAFKLEDIEFDSRTLLKCMFGCADWGKNHTCPSRAGALKPWEYQKVLERYSWGVIVHSKSMRISQEVSFAIERKAYLDGYYFAFSLSDCAICKECLGIKGQECVDPKRARPSFHSVGIDVFKTVHKFGLPLETLKEGEDDKKNWYSAVFIE